MKWKKVIERTIEGFVLICALTIVTMLGLGYGFQAAISLPSGMQWLQLILASAIVGFLASQIKDKVNL